MATMGILLTRAHRMATTVLAGSLAACLSAPARGTAATGDVDGMDRDGAEDGTEPDGAEVGDLGGMAGAITTALAMAMAMAIGVDTRIAAE